MSGTLASWRQAWRRAFCLGALLLSALVAGCASMAGVESGAVVQPSAPLATAALPEGAGAPSDAAAAAPTSLALTPPSGPLSAASPGPGGLPGLDSLSRDQTARFDSTDDEPQAKRDLWQRIREGYGLAHLENPQLVHSSEQWYASRPDDLKRMANRGARYLFHIVEEVDKRGLPTELALLPFIESAFNPRALSTAKASGMWQFMPATGRDFALRQNVFRDDRRDVLASTRAALDYLMRLQAQFGDWHLALAAYNWGEGNLQRAIQRNQREGLPIDYQSLRLPEETRRYVPKLLAVKNIVMQPEAFGVSLPPLKNHPYFLTAAVERDIDVAVAARLAGLDEAEFAALNPQHNKPVILAAGTPHILLPYANARRYLAELDRHKGPLATWTAWVAPRTLRTAEAARLTGMEESRLREVNRIPRGMMIRKGSALLVTRHGRHHHDVSEQVADNGAISLQREAAGKNTSASASKRKAGAGKASSQRTQVAAAKPATLAPAKPANRKVASAATPPAASKVVRTHVAAGADNTVKR